MATPEKQTATEVHPLDAIVNRRLAQKGIAAAPLCTDAEFLRRVCLDFSGALPGAKKSREFLLDPAPSADKRRRLVEWALARPEFADYWAMRWCDVLRVKSEFPSNLWPNAVQAYHAWLRAAFAADHPFDEVAREMLLSSGSNFRNPPVNFYRALTRRTPDEIAAQAAIVFMGVRLAPGSPDAEGFAAFFTNVRYKATGEWKEEIVYFAENWPAYRSPRSTTFVRAKFPFERQPLFPGPALPAAAAATRRRDGFAAPRESESAAAARRRAAAAPVTPPGTNPQKLVADWLVSAKNPWFAANYTNRVWAALFGRGIVEPVDNAGPANPPADPALLALLARQFRENQHRLRPLLRFIATSETYQRSWRRNASNRADRECWSHRVPRRLDAEVLADAIGSLTGAHEKFSSRIPEPLAFWPEDFRAVQNPDSSVTTSFLDMFGRPSRDTPFVHERDISPSMAQAIWLLNSSALNAKIEKKGGGVPRLARAFAAPEKHPALADELYLALLARFPSEKERTRVVRHLGDAAAGKTFLARVCDVVWVLINTKEFLHNH
ncbi:MAG: DUF1553 domain-containing protein [Puniceicoccales bacterium]|jgi:hypothetical protein|nr:DUF1553 domain-containing protein [Puniceicoccales bacterium]